MVIERKMLTKAQARDADLMMRLSEGIERTRGIVSFLYEHQAFHQIARFLISHRLTGERLIDHLELNHGSDLLSLMQEALKYGSGRGDPVYVKHLKPEFQ